LNSESVEIEVVIDKLRQGHPKLELSRSLLISIKRQWKSW